MGAARADAPTLVIGVTPASALARELSLFAAPAEMRHQQLQLQTVNGF